MVTVSGPSPWAGVADLATPPRFSAGGLCRSSIARGIVGVVAVDLGVLRSLAVLRSVGAEVRYTPITSPCWFNDVAHLDDRPPANSTFT
jgi:hypothetical protein